MVYYILTSNPLKLSKRLWHLFFKILKIIQIHTTRWTR